MNASFNRNKNGSIDKPGTLGNNQGGDLKNNKDIVDNHEQFIAKNI
jgi:hypothetical protein